MSRPAAAPRDHLQPSLSRRPSRHARQAPGLRERLLRVSLLRRRDARHAGVLALVCVVSLLATSSRRRRRRRFLHLRRGRRPRRYVGRDGRRGAVRGRRRLRRHRSGALRGRGQYSFFASSSATTGAAGKNITTPVSAASSSRRSARRVVQRVVAGAEVQEAQKARVERDDERAELGEQEEADHRRGPDRRALVRRIPVWPRTQAVVASLLLSEQQVLGARRRRRTRRRRRRL
mmetsp:Transcript_15313/g.61608  ORF Transcript_15313/g.61608 Transcript_15313/m.61608 type:complete len:233 (-) Transcript_15313:1471-2169(-)